MYFKAINYINKYISYIKNWILKFYYFIFLYFLNLVPNCTLFVIAYTLATFIFVFL